MRKRLLARTAMVLIFALGCGFRTSSGDVAPVQRQGFTPVDGPNLGAKMDAAIKLAASGSRQTPFWTAYSFDVRPGLAVDAEFNNFNGTTTTFSGAAVAIGTSSGATVETRNLGVFILREPAGHTISRVEVYNLDRRREYSGYPVYWLGRAGNEESLGLLKSIVDSNQSSATAQHATMAIALHDDLRVGAMLENFVRDSSAERVRDTAVFWLGWIPGEQPFLADLVRNEQESVQIRKKAAFAIGVSKDATALSTLQNLYASVSAREVRKQIIFAASINENKDGAVNFLIKVASNDPDRELKKQAIFWLGQKAGRRALEVLGDTVNSNDADTEVQKQAVFAISQRPKDEAVPMLINIAKTHPKAQVRKQAIFWLGRIGDERAIEFFKEILTR